MKNDVDFVDVILQYDESLKAMRKGFESGRDLVEERSLHLPGWLEDNHKKVRIRVDIYPASACIQANNINRTPTSYEHEV
jgi:hypothetical protein